METIHLKTVDPIGQALLKKAGNKGIELAWERSEKLQPQDGFLRLGLSCPLDCLHGPCRIDPFGRGPDRGICGLSRDAMVASSLLRLCHRGVLEAQDQLQRIGLSTRVGLPGILGEKAEHILSQYQLAPLTSIGPADTYGQLTDRSINFQEMVLQALRLSLLCLALSGQEDEPDAPASRICRTGYGVVAEGSCCIGLTGSPSPELVGALQEQLAGSDENGARLIALGSWIQAGDSYLPLACSSGNIELLLISGGVQFLVAGPGTEPGILDLCRQLDIPVAADTSATAEEIAKRAMNRFNSELRLELPAELPPSREFHVFGTGASLTELAHQQPEARIGLLGGSDTVHQTLGRVAQQLSTTLSADSMILGTWGDNVLWLGEALQETPAVVLDPRRGPLAAVQDLAETDTLERLAGICFTGLARCQEFATALGLAFLGCRVSVAMPVPLLGSQAVCRFLEETVQAAGGEFHHFDHPAGAEELSAWFTDR